MKNERFSTFLFSVYHPLKQNLYKARFIGLFCHTVTLVYTHVGSISSQHRSRSAHHWGNSGLLQKERGGSSLRGETTTTAATDSTCCGYCAAGEIDRRRNESPARKTYPFFNHSQGKFVLMRLQRSIASCPIVSKQRNISIFYPNFFFSMSRKSSPRKTSNFRSS